MIESTPPDAVGGLSESTIAILTPPGVGAIACVQLRGALTWGAVRQNFRPSGKQSLPELPVPQRFWFGTLGEGDAPGDEVILSTKHEGLEIHCHGGQRVVRWIVELFLARGFTEVPAFGEGNQLLQLMARATTERSAAILLDQYHGAFQQAVELILSDIEAHSAKLQRLADLAPHGRHLVEPWRVVIAGPPNVGKSSLLNALAGYSRSIVAPIAGTTRDVVTALLAFEGWPISLSDTAGLRESAEALEAEGIAKTVGELAGADLIVWVMDASAEAPVEPPAEIAAERLLVVWNKSDLFAATERSRQGDGSFQSPRITSVSALTRIGIPELIAAIVARLVPAAPVLLEAVPYSPVLADAVERAWSEFSRGNFDSARASLASCLAVRP